MSFYITLPSNSSLADFPGNTLTQFTTRLKNPMRLEGNNEIALARILYPKNWTYRNEGMLDVIAPRGKTFQIKIQFYVYESLCQLFQRIDNLIVSTGGQVELEYYCEINKVFMAIAPELTVKFNDKINEIFGLTQTFFKCGPHKFISDKLVRTKINYINALYITSDICQYHIVGDTVAPLLQVFSAIESNTDFYIEKIFDSPHYVPLARNNLKNITMDIRSDLGNPIQFQTGRIVVKLHFRRKNYYN